MNTDYVGIGKKLGSARKKLKISIQTLSEKTRIQEKYIEAIENGETQKLPGDFYVKAFIRQYANAVGIDPNSIFDDYIIPEPKGGLTTDQTVSPINKDKVVVDNGMVPKAGMARVRPNFSRKLKEKLPGILIGLLALSAVLVAWYAIANIRQDSTSSSAADRKNSIKASSNSVVSSSKKSDKSKSSKPETIGKQELTKRFDGSTAEFYFYDEENHTIKIQVSADTWTTVNVDGKTAYSGVISAGGEQTIELGKDSKSALIHFGNPNAATVLFNGKDTDFRAGAPTLTTDVNFNRERV